MSRKMSLEELADHCGRAVSSLGALLADFSASGIDKMAKRAMLISYFIGLERTQNISVRRTAFLRKVYLD